MSNKYLGDGCMNLKGNEREINTSNRIGDGRGDKFFTRYFIEFPEVWQDFSISTCTMRNDFRRQSFIKWRSHSRLPGHSSAGGSKVDMRTSGQLSKLTTKDTRV